MFPQVKLPARTGKIFRRYRLPDVYAGHPRKFTCDPSAKLCTHLSETLLLCSLWQLGSIYMLFCCEIKGSFPDSLLSKRSSGPEFSIVWLWETLVSEWGSLWESSSFVPWFVPSAFRDVSGVDPECPELAGSEETHQFGRERLKCDFPSYWTPETVSLSLYPQFSQRLEWYKPLVIWGHLCFAPRCSSDVPHNSFVKGCKFSLVPQS